MSPRPRAQREPWGDRASCEPEGGNDSSASFLGRSASGSRPEPPLSAALPWPPAGPVPRLGRGGDVAVPDPRFDITDESQLQDMFPAPVRASVAKELDHVDANYA